MITRFSQPINLTGDLRREREFTRCSQPTSLITCVREYLQKIKAIQYKTEDLHMVLLAKKKPHHCVSVRRKQYNERTNTPDSFSDHGCSATALFSVLPPSLVSAVRNASGCDLCHSSLRPNGVWSWILCKTLTSACVLWHFKVGGSRREKPCKCLLFCLTTVCS